MRVTENFTFEEARCNCGKCKLTPDLILHITSQAFNLEVIRERLNDKPMQINSWYRCKRYNRKIGGVRKSQHIEGLATDIKTNDPIGLAKVIEDLINERLIEEGGIGIYSTFVHYDSRGSKRRWNKI